MRKTVLLVHQHTVPYHAIMLWAISGKPSFKCFQLWWVKMWKHHCSCRHAKVVTEARESTAHAGKLLKQQTTGDLEAPNINCVYYLVWVWWAQMLHACVKQQAISPLHHSIFCHIAWWSNSISKYRPLHTHSVIQTFVYLSLAYFCHFGITLSCFLSRKCTKLQLYSGIYF